jgi:DNA-binding NarL/FixJ family response regulator
VIIDEGTYLAHYGIIRRSGRYPWGSGGNVSTAHHRSFLEMVDDLRRKGLSELEIAKSFSMTTTQLRAAKTISRNQDKQANIAQAQALKNKGYSNVAIGAKMGLNESTVRQLLAPGEKHKADVLLATAGMLKDQVAKKPLLDVGVGSNLHVGVSETKMKSAIAVLEREGYKIHYVKVEQLGTGQQTTLKVLTKPGVSYSEVFKNRDKIQSIADYSTDGGLTFLNIKPPLSISAKRVGVRYAENGGSEADGVIYVRPGVADVSLGGSRYAQVRIAVNGTHYLKGMAMYRDDLPHGVDLVFNTSKSNTGNKLDAMKPLKIDKETGKVDVDNPFGASISRQITTKSGKVSSTMNIVNEEGNWQKWSRSLSSQMLSKQSPVLAKSQLDMRYDQKAREFAEITSLTNPSVKRRLLDSFADDADSSSVHLKAAHLPRQANHVILPIHSMPENQIYAPNYRNGEKVVLIRHPHGGTFEIPELTVNNRHPEAKKLLGNAPDAVGINPKTAHKLSGADFDGDTVLVIPNNHGKIKTSPSLADLKNFDPVRDYPGYPGMTKMTARTKAIEMGVVSNLITDMTIRGASTSELARAVRHSMVVIDAEKHGLNYKQSAIDNGIAQLKTKYQGGPRAGAKTLISKASAEVRVPERVPRPAAKGGPVDKETGKKVFVPTGATFVKDGKIVLKTVRSTRLAEATDAHSLSSGTPIENVYAEHSNKLKALANKARLEAVHTKPTAYSPSAKKVYAKEVATLDAKLQIALRNAPLERQAQVLAGAVVTQKRQAYPDMEPADVKKLKSQALAAMRARTGAGKKRIEITDDEWAAIQAGAISTNKLNQILANADLDRVKQHATPKAHLLMTSAKQQRAISMLGSGYTQSEVADALGVSLTTLKRSLAE